MKRENNWRTVHGPKPAVSICPHCGLAKPYLSIVEHLIPCVGCKKVFMCDPPKKKNWKLFSDYEKELEDEKPKEDRRGKHPNSLANLEKSPLRKGNGKGAERKTSRKE